MRFSTASLASTLAATIAGSGCGLLGPSEPKPQVFAMPTRVAGNLTFASISAGGNHTCALTPEGAAHCWGHNDFGELGNGVRIDVTRDSDPRQNRPVPVAGGLRFKAVTAGHGHSCALTLEGFAYCWGGNYFGQLATTAPIQTCRHFFNGDRACSSSPIPVAGGLSFTAIAAGGSHTCALTPEGRVYCWGANSAGELGDGTTQTRRVPTAVAGGLRFAALTGGFFRYSCGLSAEGEMYCWGSGVQNGPDASAASLVPARVQPAWRFSAISATGNHSCGLNASGDMSCWGGNQYGQLGDGSSERSAVPVTVRGQIRFARVSAGPQRTCGIAVDGSTYCWGANLSGAIGTREPAQACGIPNLGTGGPVGEPCYKTPARVEGGPFLVIALGDDHTCGLTSEGIAYCWGRNAYAQLGIG